MQCGESFPTQTALNSHKRTHLNEDLESAEENMNETVRLEQQFNFAPP